MAHTWRSDLVLFRRLLTYARSCWGGIIGLFLLSLVSTPLALLTPVPLKIAVDNAIGGQPLPPWINAVLPAVVQRSSTTLLGAAAILLVLTALLTQWQARTSAIVSTVIGQRITLQFRTALFRHVQRLSLGYHDKKARPTRLTGSRMTRLPSSMSPSMELSRSSHRESPSLPLSM